MRDRDAHDVDYASLEHWEQPVQDAHTFGSMTLFACADYALGFSQLCRQQPPPVYSHLVVVRSVLEAGVVSAWLNDPTISTHERVRRALSEHRYHAREHLGFVRALHKLEKTDVSLARLQVAEADVARWQDVAEFLPLPAHEQEPQIGNAKVTRPEMAAAISAIVSADGTAPPTPGGVAQWKYLSAASHATWQGLKEALETQSAEPVRPGVFNTAIVVRSESIQVQASYVLRALRNAADTQFRFMGWDDETWAAAALNADRHAVWLTRAVGEALAARQR